MLPALKLRTASSNSCIESLTVRDTERATKTDMPNAKASRPPSNTKSWGERNIKNAVKPTLSNARTAVKTAIKTILARNDPIQPARFQRVNPRAAATVRPPDASKNPAIATKSLRGGLSNTRVSSSNSPVSPTNVAKAPDIARQPGLMPAPLQTCSPLPTPF